MYTRVSGVLQLLILVVIYKDTCVGGILQIALTVVIYKHKPV